MYIEKQAGCVVCLFELMLCVPVNSQGHVGTLPPFFGTLTQSENVITSNKCLKYNHPTEPQKANTYGWFDLNHVSLIRVSLVV